MRRMLALLCLLALLPCCALAEAVPLCPEYEYTWKGRLLVRSYSS